MFTKLRFLSREQFMKLKNIIISVLLCCIFIFQHHIVASTKLFSGSIEFPCKAEYNICLFYNGQKLEFESSTNSNFVQFSFLGEKNIYTLYFLVTNGLTCCTKESNNVDCLYVADEKSFICYKLEAKRESQKNSNDLLTWNISNYDLKQGQVPENSIIFLFDPSLIAGLKVISWNPENLFRIIPTLLINPTATKEELQRACNIARLAAMDMERIHEKSCCNQPHAILAGLQ